MITTQQNKKCSRVAEVYAFIAHLHLFPYHIPSVQVNSADQHLRVFDPAQKRWRQVCSSSANELLASISCEEVGFVRWDVFTVVYQCFNDP